ncbi:MAG TPA: CBS domain-containing protein, partial [Bacteroidetes bacterium]|nr:CBS domain-containing protein [Bacteroidota bacterium]
DLVANIMSWKKITHLPVENEGGEFVGLVTIRELLRHISTRMPDDAPADVKDIMVSKVPTVQGDTLTTDAISMLRKHDMTCLPVVDEKGKLIGIVTDRDFVNITDHFLQEFVQQEQNLE